MYLINTKEAFYPYVIRHVSTFPKLCRSPSHAIFYPSTFEHNNLDNKQRKTSLLVSHLLQHLHLNKHCSICKIYKTPTILHLQAETMDSPHQIFLIPEVLEPVLLNLDTTTLLLSQRVCHLWNSLIKTSPSLQTALFFRPQKEASTSTPALKPKRTVNPLMNKLLKHFVSNHRSSFHRDFSSYLSRFGPQKSSDPSTTDVERRHPYLRPEASWREMLLHQPPAPTLAVSDDLIPLSIGGVASNESNAVLRLKHLERLVQVCFLFPVGKVLIFYPMHNPPWGRAPVSFLRRVLDTCDTYIVPRYFVLTGLSTAGDAPVECGWPAGLPWLTDVGRWLKEWEAIRESWRLEYLTSFM